MPLAHAALALLVAAIWGFNFVVIREGLDVIPPIFLCALRFALAGFPAILFVRRPEIPWRQLGLLSLFLVVAQFSLLFLAMQAGLPPGLASLLLQIQGLFTLVLATALLGERPRPLAQIGIAIAFAAFAAILAGAMQQVGTLALVLALLAAFAWASANIVTRRIGDVAMLPLIVWASFLGTPALFALSLAVEGFSSWAAAFNAIGAKEVAVIAFLAFAATLFGFGAWSWLISRNGAAMTAPFSLLVPVFGMASAWAVYGESQSGPRMAVSLLVLAGLALMVRSQTRTVAAFTRP